MQGIAAFLRSGVIIGAVLIVTMGLLWLLYYSFPLAIFIFAPVAMLLADAIRSRLNARSATAKLATLTSDQMER